jgi:hypothetical protein
MIVYVTRYINDFLCFISPVLNIISIVLALASPLLHKLLTLKSALLFSLTL